MICYDCQQLTGGRCWRHDQPILLPGWWRSDTPKPWTKEQITDHLAICARTIEVGELGRPGVRLVCGCGEASKHSVAAVARAVVDDWVREVVEE